MPVNPSLALQKAIVQKLRDDAAIIALLGGAKIHDRPPRREQPPYVALGDIEARAWNTFTARGTEHKVTLHIWSEHGGRRQAYEIIARIDELLDDAALTLTDHHLVNLRSVFWTALRARDGRLFHGLLRLRATTHPLQ